MVDVLSNCLEQVSAPPLSGAEPPIDFGHLSRMTLGERRLEREVLALFDRQADLLIGAGCLASLETSAVSLGEFGAAPRFTAAMTAGTLRMKDATCPALHAAFPARSSGLISSGELKILTTIVWSMNCWFSSSIILYKRRMLSAIIRAIRSIR